MKQATLSHIALAILVALAGPVLVPPLGAPPVNSWLVAMYGAFWL